VNGSALQPPQGGAGGEASRRLVIDDLSITYKSGRGDVSGLRRCSFTVEPGRAMGVVGESGSGKSSLGLAIMRLLPKSAKTSGRILLGGRDLLAYSEAEMRRIRGKGVGMVFQDPLASLNPVFTVQSQLVGTLRLHKPELSRRQAVERAGDMLEEMGIQRKRLKSFPHEFSGGMRQRVMIAAALASDPDFLIADEATSDLDTITQKQILELLIKLQETRGIGLILVSHDLNVIRRTCHDVAVLYRGDLVEVGETDTVLSRSQHWYTRGLLAVSTRERRPDGTLITLPSRSRAHLAEAGATAASPASPAPGAAAAAAAAPEAPAPGAPS